MALHSPCVEFKPFIKPKTFFKNNCCTFTRMERIAPYMRNLILGQKLKQIAKQKQKLLCITVLPHTYVYLIHIFFFIIICLNFKKM